MLTDDKKRLKIFENGIRVDSTLPKHVAIEESKKKNKKEENGTSFPFEDHELVEIARGTTFDELRDMDAHSINIYLSENEYQHFLSGGRYNLGQRTPNPIIIPVYKHAESKGKSLIKRIFGRANGEEDKFQLDVVNFFSEVKKTAKLNKEAYANRVEGYIKAIKSADIAGQEAFKEKLLRELVINKYESFLYATGNYYAIKEETVVEFAKKSEKGVNLVYANQYLRPIPMDIINKIKEMNEMEIFDNYVIMHYDPENRYSGKTHREAYKEEEKRRDPILFGVIQGSNKLYYIADWVDEYCNLTLDEFVGVLQMDKEDLKISENVEF